jgi:hypothetical protein
MKRYVAIAIGLLMLTAISTTSLRAATFPECPAVGSDTGGCEFLITVTAVNAAGAGTAFTVAASSPDLGPYDGSDDTLVGLLNSSSGTLKSVGLTSTLDIFGFDGDGACDGAYAPGPTAAQCLGGAYQTSDPGDYESVGARFTGINVAQTSGIVNVNLAAGGSTWFSLENQLTVSSITPSTVPEPGTIILTATGLSALFLRRRRNVSV